jgi:O-antigen ligase
MGIPLIQSFSPVSKKQSAVNLTSIVFFFLGMLSAALFAIGMDPYSCGIPLLLLALAVAFGSWRRDDSLRAGWLLCLVAVVIVYFSVRMIFSPIADFGRSDGLLLCGAVLAFWWTVANGIKDSFRYWLCALWVLTLANVGVAMVQAYQDVNFYPVYDARATLYFPSGLYLHYNHFANFLLGVGMLSLGYGMAGEMRRVMRIVCILMYAICCYGIYLAHSRGAWLGLGCGTALVAVGWLANLWRLKKSWAGFALVAATVLAPVLITGAWRVGTSAVANRNTGDSGRLEFASIAVDLIQEKPLWGGGSRSYFFDSFKKWNPNELWIGTGDIQYVHNEYLQVAVDYGLVGLALLLLLFVLVMFRGVALLSIGGSQSQGDAGIALGAMAALCSMGVQAFFSFVYHVLPDVMLMACCVGWLVRQPWVLDQDRKSRTGVSRISWSHGVVGLTIAGCAAWVSARDAAAWYVMHPRFEMKTPAKQELVARYARAVAVRPDFRVISSMTRAMLQLNRLEDEPLDAKRDRLIVALDWQEKAVARCPQNYLDSLNLALMYDSLGRHNDAEPQYEKVVDVLAPREMHYGARYFYARHLAARANVVWRQREPEKALVLFMRANEEMAKSRNTGFFKESDPAVKTMIEKSISFLQGANIQPAAKD